MIQKLAETKLSKDGQSAGIIASPVGMAKEAHRRFTMGSIDEEQNNEDCDTALVKSIVRIL